MWFLDLQTSNFGGLVSTNHYRRLQCIFRCPGLKRLTPPKSALKTSTYFTPTITYIISKFKRLQSPKPLLILTWTCNAYNHLNDSYMHLNMGREAIRNHQQNCFFTNIAMLWPHVNATFQRRFLPPNPFVLLLARLVVGIPSPLAPLVARWFLDATGDSLARLCRIDALASLLGFRPHR